MTTWNWRMSPPYSSSRFTAQGEQDAVEVAAAGCRIPFRRISPSSAALNRPSGDSLTGEPLMRVEGHLLHQLLQPFGDRALAAADRAQQVEDLLLLFEPLCGVPEVGDHLLDGVLHAVELA